jgi:3-deoxy-7-phosphoheptulonate synthase
MVSGLSMPVGFKNSTDGNLQIAIEAMTAARQPQHFIGIDPEGQTSVLETTGNQDTHVILRGSRTGSNYRKPDIVYAAELLKESGFEPAIVVDCSHGNAEKQPARQEEVLASVLASRRSGCREVIGFMLESNLKEGRQAIPADPRQLEYGVSVTDACIGWETTERLLEQAFRAHEL